MMLFQRAWQGTNALPKSTHFLGVLLAFLMLATIALTFGDGHLMAQEPQEPSAHEKDVPYYDTTDVRESLKSGSFPWYDSASDSTRKVELTPTKQDNFAPPQRDWVAKSKPPKTPPPARTAPAAPQGSGWISTLFSILGYTLFGVLIVVICYFAARSFLSREVLESSATKTKVVDTKRQANQVEKLPVDLANATGNLLDMVRRLMAEGNYSAAIIYLYAHQLVCLDDAHYIRLAKGKTNRQYLRELRSDRPMARLVEQTIVLFEDAFFGKKTILADAFNTCWKQLPQFDSLVQQRVKGGAS